MPELSSAIDSPSPRHAQADRDRAVLITHVVAYATGVSALDIAATGRRAQTASEARAVAMYLAHTELSWPLARVGAAFGRDRTTVGHACHRVEDRRDDAAFDARLAELGACVPATPATREDWTRAGRT